MIKKYDWIVLAAVLILAGGFWLGQFIARKYAGPESFNITAEISLEGNFWKSIPLDGSGFSERIQTGNGFNEIRVDQAGAAVILADCPDQICVHMGLITRPGEIIVCMPHKLVLALRNATPGKAQEDSIDAVSQ